MKKIKELRGERSQRQVARDLRISVAYYNYIETGERVPSLTVAAKIAAYYNVDMNTLFYLKDGGMQLL